MSICTYSYGAYPDSLGVNRSDWVCSANAAGTLYFWFSAFDEPWKAIHGGVEPYWGLFDSDYNLKDIVIPACIA